LVVRTIVAAIRISHGHGGLRGQCGEDDAIAVGQRVLPAVGKREAEATLEPFFDLCVDVAAHGLPLERRADGDTVLVEIACAEGIGNALVATGDAEVVVGHQGVAVELVLPVGTAAKQVGADIGAHGILDTGGSDVVVVLCILLQVHHIELFRHGLPADVSVIGDGGLSGLSASRGNHDDTVRGARTVDGRGGGILEDVHRDNVVGVDGGQRVGVALVTCR